MTTVLKQHFYTIEEASKILHFSYGTVRSLCVSGKIKAVQPVGNQWRIPYSEMERLANAEGAAATEKLEETQLTTPVFFEEIEVEEQLAPYLQDRPYVPPDNTPETRQENKQQETKMKPPGKSPEGLTWGFRLGGHK